MPDTTDAKRPITRAAMTGRLILLIAASILLGIVILSPALLSSQDLLRWAGTGLGLDGAWRWLVFIALDAAAVACILMSIYASTRGEEPGAFGLGTWLFAGISAFANFQHGSTLRETFPDAWWFFPSMSVLGPFLLEITLKRIRRWVREAAGSLHLPWWVRVLRFILAPRLASRAFRRWVLNHPAAVPLLPVQPAAPSVSKRPRGNGTPNPPHFVERPPTWAQDTPTRGLPVVDLITAARRLVPRPRNRDELVTAMRGAGYQLSNVTAGHILAALRSEEAHAA
jgi:hypothetical protein